MRRFLQILLLVAMALPFASNAQTGVGDYAMSTGADATKWITLDENATSIVSTYVDDNAYGTFPLGITFNFCGTDYTDFSVSSNGHFRLGTEATAYSAYSYPFNSSNAGQNCPKIHGVGCDLGTGSNGYIKYEVMGTAPNRTFVCEYAMGYTYGSTREGDVRWQIQLDETTNHWRIVYGDTPTTSPSSFQIGASTSASDVITINPNTHTASTGTTSTGYSVWPGAYRYYEFAATSCNRPTDLTVSNLTDHSVTLSWSAGGSETEWYGTISPAVNGVSSMALTDTTITINGLDASTSYTVSIQSVCSATDTSSVLSASFTTPCSNEPLPYMADYNNFASCWNRYTGELNNVLNGTVSLSSTTGGWNTSSNVFGAQHYKVNIYGVNCKYWMVTPSIDITANAHMLFDAALTAYGNGNAPSTVGDDDRFVVLATTDNGATWTPVMQFDTSATAYATLASIPNTGATYEVMLSQFLNQTVRFAFYGESLVSNADNDLHVHNIVVEEIPSCPRPTNLAVSNVTTNSATLTWQVGASETAWQVEYKLANDSVWTMVESVITDTTFTLTNLAHSSNYDVMLRAYCSSDDQSPWIAASFTTQCGVNELPWSEDFADGFNQCWARQSGLVNGVLDGTVTPTTTTSGWNVVTTGNGISNKHVKVNVFGTSCKYWMITPEIAIDGNAVLSFDAALTGYGNGNAPSQVSNDDRFVVLMTTDDSSWTILREWNADSNNADIFANIPNTATNYSINVNGLNNATVRFAFYGESTVSGGDNDLHVGNISVTAGTTIDTVAMTMALYAEDVFDGATSIAMGDAALTKVFTFEIDDLVTAGTTYTLNDMTIAGMIDYTTFEQLAATQATFVRNMNGVDTLVNATMLAGNTYYILTYASQGVVVPDTIHLVMDTMTSEYYPEDNDWYTILRNDDYGFAFDIVATTLVNGTTYTLNDMLEDYSYGMDFNTYDEIDFAAATYTQFATDTTIDVHAVVNSTTGTVYDITYHKVIGPVVIDTINVTAGLYMSFYDEDQELYIEGLAPADTTLEFQFGFYDDPVLGVTYTLDSMLALGLDYVNLEYIYPIEATYMKNVANNILTVNATMFTGTKFYQINYTEALPADSVNIMVLSADSTMGTVTGTGRYEVGENVTIAAIANEGYHFVAWNDQNTEANRTIVASTDMTFTATFEANPVVADSVNITVVSADETMGTVTGTGRYAVGENVTITAVANNGYHFVAWDDQNTEATRTIVASADMTLTATFAQNVGIEIADLSDIKVYPNPTLGKVTVSSDNVTKVEVLDLVGRMVSTVEGTNVIDLSKLNNGVYTLRITTTEGVAVRKVIKK